MISAVALSDDAAHAVSAALDGRLIVWNLKDGSILRDQLRPDWKGSDFSPWVVALAVSRDTRRGISALGNGRITVWDLEKGSVLREVAASEGRGQIIALTPDTRHAVQAIQQGALVVYNLEAEEEPRLLPAQGSDISSLSVTPDCRWAVATSIDTKTVTVRDLESGAVLHSLPYHAESMPFARVAITPNGQLAVSGFR